MAQYYFGDANSKVRPLCRRRHQLHHLLRRGGRGALAGTDVSVDSLLGAGGSGGPGHGDQRSLVRQRLRLAHRHRHRCAPPWAPSTPPSIRSPSCSVSATASDDRGWPPQGHDNQACLFGPALFGPFSARCRRITVIRRAIAKVLFHCPALPINSPFTFSQRVRMSPWVYLSCSGSSPDLC